MPLHRVEWQCSKDGPARHNGLCAQETYGADAVCDSNACFWAVMSRHIRSLASRAPPGRQKGVWPGFHCCQPSPHSHRARAGIDAPLTAQVRACRWRPVAVAVPVVQQL